MKMRDAGRAEMCLSVKKPYKSIVNNFHACKSDPSVAKRKAENVEAEAEVVECPALSQTPL